MRDLVRLHARNVQKILDLLLRAFKLGPMPPPAGGSGSGGAPAEAFAWPPAGRNRGSRFDGGADAELLQLFKRNKRVLERSDEVVISRRK